MKIPQALINSLQGVVGFEEETFLQVHQTAESPIAIRLNPFKPIQQFEQAATIQWAHTGKYLNARPHTTFDPLFHAGTYQIQEASAMFLEFILTHSVDLNQPLVVLDLCAAPGGKSTHLASLLSSDSLLVCNEVMKPRANILADNLTKWGTMNTIVTNNDPKDFIRLSGLFDVIIIDAPSSGSGLFRKDPEAVKEWSEENVLLYAQRQKRIIDDAWGSLKQGGILIYSTSSYSPAENEEIATWICEEFDAKPLTFDYEGQTKQQFFRFYPDKMKGEGFFITALQKTSSEKEVFIRSGKPIKNNNRRTEREIFRHWVSDIDKHTWFEKNSEYFLVNPLHEHLIQRLDSILSLIKLGVKLGKIAVKELIPDHELAVSLHLTNEINTIEVSLEEALKYLRKDDFSLAETKKGWTLITFQGYSLGWAKVLPNRVNNYYPKELRIVSRENPENESK